jgi:nucleotide sugar dehydrogenase
MKLCVVGTGYVGLVSGVCYAEKGNDVICVDMLKEKVDNLNKDIMPIYEDGLEEMCARNRKNGRLKFTTDIEYGIKSSDIIFIAVGTPSLPNGHADLSQVESVAMDIAKYINGYKLIVNKSTVPVGTQKLVTKIILDNSSNTYKFDVVSNPEFLREGTAIHDTINADRIVIGADSSEAADILKELNRCFDIPVFITDPESSEMVKYATNALLATKISFINEIASICSKVGANVSDVSKGIGMDRRLSDKFLDAGIGFGGSCLPKDTRAITMIAEAVGYKLKIVNSVIEVNRFQRLMPLEKLKIALPNIEGKTIAILGLSFKPNTDDLRESPAVEIIKEIIKSGGNVKAYDPIGMNNAKKVLPGIPFGEDVYSTVKDADATILVTEWKEFKNMDLFKVLENMRENIFIDGRNVFDYETMSDIGFEYYCIGKKDAEFYKNQLVFSEVASVSEFEIKN